MPNAVNPINPMDTRVPPGIPADKVWLAMCWKCANKIVQQDMVDSRAETIEGCNKLTKKQWDAGLKEGREKDNMWNQRNCPIRPQAMAKIAADAHKWATKGVTVVVPGAGNCAKVQGIADVPKGTRYLLVVADSKQPLVDVIQELAELGWRAEGGLATEASASYIQAMTKPPA